MILPALISLAAHVDLTAAHGMDFVAAFVTAARTGLDPDVFVPPLPGKGERPSRATFLEEAEGPRKKIHVYQYAGATVYLDSVSGRVDYYSDAASNAPTARSDPNRSALVSSAQATALARRFYAASGWGPEIFVYRVDGLNGDGTADVTYAPSWHGVPYDYRTALSINLHTGQLERFGKIVDWLPAPPASPVPGGTPEQARLAALAAATPRLGSALATGVSSSMALTLWYVGPGAISRTRGVRPRDRYAYSVSADQFADLRAGRAILAYRGVLYAPGGLLVTLVLDAQTGTAIALEQTDLSGSFGGATQSKPPDLSVPTVPRPWRVATGKKGWDAWTPPAAAALAPVPGTAPVKGAKLTLTDGRAAFPATYDPKANLLAISGKAYRPGPALTALLKRRTKG